MPKPAVKPAPAAKKEETPVAMPPKSKKLLVIGICLLMVIAVGGAAWFFAEVHVPALAHAEETKPPSVHEVKFISLGENFTVNLQREESNQYLQAGITLKILQPELEEKINAMMPEIRSKLLFLLSSKKPSELLTVGGKKQLINEIIAETDAVLGVSDPVLAAPEHEVATHTEAAASAPAAPLTTLVVTPKTKGVTDVLFTSFFIR